MMEKHEKVTGKDGRLLTPNEVAEHLQVTAEQVRVLIRRGQLSAVNAGTGTKRPLYRITQEALEAFLNFSRQPVSKTQNKKLKQDAPIPDFFPHLK